MKLLLIIPAYNEQENIVRVVNNLKQNYKEFDYVVVNDGSKDDTPKLCRENNFNLIDLPVNLGLAGAFQTGLKYAYNNNYDYALQFDADGQHRPEFIKDMINEIQKGYDIVIASRFVNKKKPRSLRMLGSNIISFAIKLTTGKTIKDPTAGMRMFNKKTIEEFSKNINYGPEPDTISYMIKNGAKIKEVQVEMDERIAGESYINFVGSIWYMLRMSLSIFLIQFFR
ncbi:MAG: glycosyltransferase family 2 protein, partial [Clostridia bacterium]|nr:glycosyltransferase family 2 protein [Clostridia bacterium]